MRFHLNSKELTLLHIIGAIFTLVGTIIGAGILGIPAVIAEAGFVTGMIVVGIMAAFFMFTYLNLGEAILRTKGEHQLPGLAERYLGKKGKSLFFIAMLMSSYGSLIAYLLASGEAVFELLQGYIPLAGIFDGPLLYSIIFFLIMSLIILKGLNVIEDSEILITGFLLLSVLLIFGLTLFDIDLSNLSGLEPSKVYIPYGAIFFAFMGFNSVPEAVRILKKRRKLVPLVLVLSVVIPMIAYVLFSTAVVGVMGPATNELGTLGLEKIVGPGMLIIGSLFLLFSVTTSFLAIGFAQENVFHLDYKLPKLFSWFLACGIPFILFIAIRDAMGFVRVLSISGAVFGGIMAALLILISYRSKKHGQRKPEYTVPMPLPMVVLLLAMLAFGVATLFM
ncbi:MAG: aromatic amino acid transport family protein [Nanoarchaeota archaeon]